jgi:hypothetical protein
MEFAPHVYYRCPACEKFVSNCGHVNQGIAFTTGRKLTWGKGGLRTVQTKKITVGKTSFKTVPTSGDDTPNFGSNVFDPRGEKDEKEFIRFEWEWRTADSPEIERGWDWSQISPVAPEIEYRVWRVAHFELAKFRYRAPHEKVRALRNAGLTQPQIALKLKVSERTIRARIEELPPEAPKETTAADLLALRVRDGGGWAKGNSWQRWTKKPFWPGADNIPRGSTESRPDTLFRSPDIKPEDKGDPCVRMRLIERRRDEIPVDQYQAWLSLRDTFRLETHVDRQARSVMRLYEWWHPPGVLGGRVLPSVLLAPV